MKKITLIVDSKGSTNNQSCFDSILNQTRKNFDVFCIGNVEEKRFLDSGISFTTYDESTDLNAVIKDVETEYVLLMTSNDCLGKKLLEKTLLNLEKFHLDIVCFGYKLNDEVCLPKFGNGIYNLKDKKELLFSMPNLAFSKIYKTSLLKNNTFYFDFCDLGVTSKLLLEAKNVACLGEVLVKRTLKEENRLYKENLIKMFSDVLKHYEDAKAYETYKEELNYLIETNLIKALKEAMNSKDKKAVKAFIDEVYDFREYKLKNTKDKYGLRNDKDNKIYLSKFLTKVTYSKTLRNV